jgi:hypothetical protein
MYLGETKAIKLEGTVHLALQEDFSLILAMEKREKGEREKEYQADNKRMETDYKK